jgi:hypothetical protein
MIGYCKDGEYMTVVYEYMPEGTLQEHIAGMQSGLAISIATFLFILFKLPE